MGCVYMDMSNTVMIRFLKYPVFGVCACKLHVLFSETWKALMPFLRNPNMLAWVLQKKPGYCCMYTSYSGFWLLQTICAGTAKWCNRNKKTPFLYRWQRHTTHNFALTDNTEDHHSHNQRFLSTKCEHMSIQTFKQMTNAVIFLVKTV